MIAHKLTTATKPAHSQAQLSMAFLSLIFVLLHSGCAGPCRILAETICACEATLAQERACLEQVDVASAAREREITEADEAQCEQLLDTCSCDALDRGDVADCGLAKRPHSPADSP